MISENPDEVFSALAPHRYLQFIPCLDSFDGIKMDTSLNALQYGRFLERIYKKYATRLRAGKWLNIRSFDNRIGMLGGYPPENCGFLDRCSRAYLVESNGNIYPYDFYALDEWLLGNIHDHSFYKLAASPAHTEFLVRSWTVDPDCKECAYFSICRGGCCRNREQVLGDVGKNKLCEGYQYFFSHCLNDMKLLSEKLLSKK